MTFAQLRTFVAAARNGSIRGAAAELLVSEPSVSAAISSLSRELGVQLTERVGRGIRLTDAGRAFAEYAARILGLTDRAVRAAREAAGGGGHVRLAAVTTAGEYVVPSLLATFLRDREGLQVSIEVGNRTSTIAHLLNEDADLAVGGRPPADGEIEGRAFLDNPLVVVGRAGHPLAAQRAFDPERLAGETWLLREPGSGTRETTEEFLAANGIEPGSVMNVNSNGAVKRAAALGLGVTLISRDAVAEELETGELAHLRARGTPVNRSWYALYRRDAALPPGARSFLEFLTAPDSGRRRARGVRGERPARPGGVGRARRDV